MSDIELNTGDLFKFRIGKYTYGSLCFVMNKIPLVTRADYCRSRLIPISPDAPKEVLEEAIYYKCEVMEVVSGIKHTLYKHHHWGLEDSTYSVRIKKLSSSTALT